MSNNPNFYNNFCGSTFQNVMPSMFVPPPPPPPLGPFTVPTYALPLDILDQEYVKNFENIAPNVTPMKRTNPISISQMRDKLRSLVYSLNELKRQREMLEESAKTCSEDEWKKAVDQVNRSKIFIDNSLSDVNSSCLNMLRKLLSKRSAKRMRLKRLRIEKKREKEDKFKQLKEKSRKIDENLQKIKDAITKAEQVY